MSEPLLTRKVKFGNITRTITLLEGKTFLGKKNVTAVVKDSGISLVKGERTSMRVFECTSSFPSIESNVVRALKYYRCEYPSLIKDLPTEHGVMHLVQDTEDTWLIMSEQEFNFGCVTILDLEKFVFDEDFRNNLISIALTF